MSVNAFYTVDRLGTLVEGGVLNYFHPKIREEDLNFMSSRHPNGISAHGRQYLEMIAFGSDAPNAALELYFEEVRRSCSPELPSRFESIFCCRTLEEARAMRGHLDGTGQIFEVYPHSGYFIANMSLLDNTGTVFDVQRRAFDYWYGCEGSVDKPIVWEVVVKLPALVGKRVE